MYCHNCGSVLKEGAKFCTICGANQSEIPQQTMTVSQVAKKTGVTRKQIVKLAILSVVLIVLGVGYWYNKSEVIRIEPHLKQQEQPKKEIPYEIIERWDINNGGEGKQILISRDYLNETDMKSLGDKLRNDTKNDRNAMIEVYTDRKAAYLRYSGKVLSDEISKTDLDFYSKHYIGEYTKNGNTGYNQFAIFLDGIMGKHYKTIKYH